MLKIAITLALALAGPAVEAGRTVVIDRAALQRLRGNTGVTLQWISFESPERGHVVVRQPGALVRLSGSQRAKDGRGLLELDGHVLAIGPTSFTFRGRIVITDAPDIGRNCVREGDMEFKVTQNRRYWRLQQMEQCDGLTDYVDIYF